MPRVNIVSMANSVPYVIDTNLLTQINARVRQMATQSTLVMNMLQRNILYTTTKAYLIEKNHLLGIMKLEFILAVGILSSILSTKSSALIDLRHTANRPLIIML